MGASLSARFEWTSNDVSTNQLAKSVQNQELLKELLSMVNQIAVKNPAEAKAEFKKSIQWPSSLLPAQFSNGKYASLFNIQMANAKYESFLLISLEILNLRCLPLRQNPMDSLCSILKLQAQMPLFLLLVFTISST
jgi:hypothetical protein